MLDKNLNLVGADSEITESDNNLSQDSLNDNNIVNNTDSSDNTEMDKKPNSMKWYILRAMGGKEQKTLIAIEKEIERLNLNKYVSKLFIPVEKVVKIRNGKKITKDRNYLSGYILVNANLVGETALIIRNVPNVLGFLKSTSSGEPIPMRDSEVDRILGKADELLDSNESIMNVFIIGESVKIIDGPFNSFNGVVEKIDEQKKKLAVSVSIFGRKQPVEVSFIQVEKI